MKSNYKLQGVLIAAVLALAGGPVQSQSIQVSPDAFIDTPALPFAPARAAPAAVVPIAPVVAPVVVKTFELLKGRRVDEQLRSYGKEAGWEVIWQAPEYVLDQNMTLQGDFEAAVEFFLKGTNVAGSRLSAVFYRGNKTVRVAEF